MPGRRFPGSDLAVPSRTPPGPLRYGAPGILTDRMSARPIPPGARGTPVSTAASGPPPLFRGGLFFFPFPVPVPVPVPFFPPVQLVGSLPCSSSPCPSSPYSSSR